MRGEIVEHQLRHRRTGFLRCTADVGQQDHVVHRQQFSRHVGLILEHIEARRLDGAVTQRLNQRRFIDNAAASDVNERATGTERAQHFLVDQVKCAGTSRSRDNEEI